MLGIGDAQLAADDRARRTKEVLDELRAGHLAPAIEKSSVFGKTLLRVQPGRDQR